MTNHELTLTEEEDRQVQDALKRWPTPAGKKRSLDSLLNKWALFVRTVQQGYADSIYEYTNDLSIRDIIQDILDSVDESARSKIGQAVSASDEAFIEATRPSDRPVAPGVATQSKASRPWLFRIPVVLEDELLEDMSARGLA